MDRGHITMLREANKVCLKVCGEVERVVDR